MRITLSQTLNVVAVALLVTLAVMLLAPRLRARPAAAAEPPSIEELHRSALVRAASNTPDAAKAWEDVLRAFADPEARELYERGVGLKAAHRDDDAEVAFSVALRRERERDMEW